MANVVSVEEKKKKKIRAIWDRLAGRFPKGETARAALEKRLAEEARKKAEAAKPPPPDPKDVLLATWAARNPDEVVALFGVIDGFIRESADNRRFHVDVHSKMAFHEGECASLERLKAKLVALQGQADPLAP